MKKRWPTLLVLLATWPLLTAGGGINPDSTARTIVGPKIPAVIAMDPHMAAGNTNPDGTITLTSSVTTTAKHASVWLRNGTLNSYAQFQILPSFALYRGCDLSLTDTRFLYSTANPTKLRSWIPTLELQALFLPLGITVDPTHVQPVITEITSARCVSDPANPGPLTDGGDGSPSNPGLLTLEATVEFLVLPK